MVERRRVEAAVDAFHEDSPYRPRTPYNASKAGADHAVRSYFETFDLPVTITNCANNYGPNQFPENVIPLFTVKALNGEQLPLYAARDNRREWRQDRREDTRDWRRERRDDRREDRRERRRR